MSLDTSDKIPTGTAKSIIRSAEQNFKKGQISVEEYAAIKGEIGLALDCAKSNGRDEVEITYEIEDIARRMGCELPSRRRSSSETPIHGKFSRLSNYASSASTSDHLSKKSFMQKFDELTGDSKHAVESLEFLRGNSDKAELERALRRAMRSLDQDRIRAKADPVGAILSDPEQNFFWDTLGRYVAGAAISKKATSLMDELKRGWQRDPIKTRGWDGSSAYGDALFPIPTSPDALAAVLEYGAFRDLAVRPMPGNKTKFAKVSGLPAIGFITPTTTAAARTIPNADSAISATSVSQECNLVTGIIEIGLELLSEEKIDFASVILDLCIRGIASRIDFAVFSGDGTDNQASGAQTGIFLDGNVQTVAANAANTTIPQLQRNDFLAAVKATAPAALQRPCRWYINPAFLADLLTIKDGAGPQYLLKTPAETGGEWNLVGFPVTWAAQAPSAAVVGSKIAAFGSPDAYLIGVREEFEIMSSDTAKWNQALRQIRALTRARCDMREATWLTTLSLAQK